MPRALLAAKLPMLNPKRSTFPTGSLSCCADGFLLVVAMLKLALLIHFEFAFPFRFRTDSENSQEVKEYHNDHDEHDHHRDDRNTQRRSGDQQETAGDSKSFPTRILFEAEKWATRRNLPPWEPDDARIL